MRFDGGSPYFLERQVNAPVGVTLTVDGPYVPESGWRPAARVATVSSKACIRISLKVPFRKSPHYSAALDALSEDGVVFRLLLETLSQMQPDDVHREG